MKKTFIIFPALMLLIAGCVQTKQQDLSKPLGQISNAVNEVTAKVEDLSERVDFLELEDSRMNNPEGSIARVVQDTGKLNVFDSEGAQMDTIKVYEDGLTPELIVSLVSPNKKFLAYGFWKGEGGIFSIYDSRDKTIYKIHNVISNIKPAVWLSDNRYSFYEGCVTPECNHYISINSDTPWIFREGFYKTYVNDNFEIQLDIPEHWTIRNEVSSDSNIVWNRGIIGESRPEISVRPLKDGETLESLKEKSFYPPKDVTVDGKVGFEWDCSGMLCVGVDVIHNTRVYSFSLEIIRDDLIFSSIKFLD